MKNLLLIFALIFSLKGFSKTYYDCDDAAFEYALDEVSYSFDLEPIVLEEIAKVNVINFDQENKFGVFEISFLGQVYIIETIINDDHTCQVDSVLKID